MEVPASTITGTIYRAVGNPETLDRETALEKAKAVARATGIPVLNDCDYGQSHLGSEVSGEHQCGKCSGAENTDSGDESGHLKYPLVLHEKAEPGLFQDCFVCR